MSSKPNSVLPSSSLCFVFLKLNHSLHGIFSKLIVQRLKFSLVGTISKLHNCGSFTLTVDASVISPSFQVKSLGVIIDSTLRNM